jgi:hypothetical protein
MNGGMPGGRVIKKDGTCAKGSCRDVHGKVKSIMVYTSTGGPS